MKALVDTTAPVQRIAQIVIDEDTNERRFLTELLPDSARIVEVVADEEVFAVAGTLIWVSCGSSCVVDQCYYDTKTCTIKAINNASTVTAL